MSMMSGLPRGGSTAVGDTVASFGAYEGAQKAVSALIAADVPARDIAIVGMGLRSIERVTGRLGYATAARSGAVNGLLLGLFLSAILVFGSPTIAIQVFIGVMFVGIALGMLLSIITYSLVRRRRDYASVMQVIADHYDVTVADQSIHRARQVLGGTAAVSRAVAAPPPAAQVTHRPQGTDAPAQPTAPPRYGERVAAPAETDAAVPVAPAAPVAPAGDSGSAPPTVDDERDTARR